MTKKRGSIDTIPPSAFKESLERLKPLLPTSELPQLLIELEKSLFPAIRINPLKSSSEDAQKWSHHYGWELVPIPFCKTGYVVKKSEVSISRVIEHKMGNFYIQDAASMLPVEL
jgi:16S rRNA (cytosine1407-C5)-methyltransferase